MNPAAKTATNAPMQPPAPNVPTPATSTPNPSVSPVPRALSTIKSAFPVAPHVSSAPMPLLAPSVPASSNPMESVCPALTVPSTTKSQNSAPNAEKTA